MNKQTLPVSRVERTCCRKKWLTGLLSAISLLACLQVRAGLPGDSAHITMHLERAPIVQAFHIIRQQTPYRVIYDNSLVKAARPVTVSVENEKLPVVLNLLFRGQPFEYRVIDKSIIITPRKPARQSAPAPASPVVADTIITGRVVADSTLLPLAGATITVRETNTSLATDNEGRFRLALPAAGATLVITYVGYETQTIRVNERSGFLVRVVLTKTQQEMKGVTVVSTGYQEIPKERATGSFTQISNRLYNQQVGTDVISRLYYITNGLTGYSMRAPTGTDVIIRGLSTIQGPQTPLIIVDNFPYNGDINNINPNDIESVTVLKDAAASSIWGAKAGNGVIVFTTRKGKYNQRTRVGLTTNITVSDQPNLGTIPNISTSDFIEVETQLFDKGHYDYQFAYPEYYPLTPVIQLLNQQRSGILSPEETKSKIDALRGLDVRDEFSKYFYQKAYNQQYAINIQGGSNNIAWLFSGGFDKNISDLAAGYDRINLHLANTYKVSKRLDISTSVYYIQSKSTVGRPAYNSISGKWGAITPYTQFADASGVALPLYNDYYREGYIDTVGAGKLLNWKYYPLEDYKYVNNTTNTQDINAVIGVDYKIFGFLNLGLKYRYEQQRSENRINRGLESYFTRDLINSFSQLNRSTGDVKYIIPKGDILDLNKNVLSSQNFRGQLNFNKTWGNHDIVALVGSEINEVKNEGNAYRTYGYDRDILTFGNVDYINTYPHFIYGSKSFIPNPSDFNEGSTRFVSFFGNGAYTYRDKYTISLSARKDGSNLFGVNTNDKWKPLWSAGASWSIYKESFYHFAPLPYLRLRLSYGYSGNVDPGKVAITTIGYSGTSLYTRTPYGQVRNFYNPELRWEQTNMLNLGIDFKSKENRISGSLEYYKKRMNDLYGLSPVDITVGIATTGITKNIGKMQGNGFDIELNTININRKVKWTSNFIFNTYRDKVTVYQDSISTLSAVSAGIIALDGYPEYSLFSYKSAGLNHLTGDPQGYLNKEVSMDYDAILNNTPLSDLVYSGSLLPTVFGSVGNTISFKNISLTARINYKFGYYFRRESINYGLLIDNSTGHSDYSKRWQKPGDEIKTDVPSMIYPASLSRDLFYLNSEALTTKGDHIRLQYINLSYEIGQRSLKGLPFESLQFFMVVNNLGIIWRANKEHLDPDYPSNTVLPAKSYSFGVRVQLK